MKRLRNLSILKWTLAFIGVWAVAALAVNGVMHAWQDRGPGGLILRDRETTSSVNCGTRTERPGSATPILMALLFMTIVACGGDAVPASTAPSPPSFPVLGEPVEQAPLPDLDANAVGRGQVLFGANCAVCHGANGEGDPNWQTQNDDGSFPPPPHDADGHTWHHADQLLVDIVLNGSDFPRSNMPLFAGSLSESDVMDILEFFKSTWGPTERDVNWQATQRVLAEQE